jgi:FtsP/CotA-like multicopper oxidase with cupredoxin domain
MHRLLFLFRPARVLPLVAVCLMAVSALAVSPPAPGKIAKWVDPLPTFVGNRVDGTQPLTVTMKEFQQEVLPASFYQGLPAPYNAGTFVWGYEINDGARVYGPHYPGFTVEAQRGVPTTMTYVNDLVNPYLQSVLKVDQTLHWADPLMEMGSREPYSGPVPTVVHLHGGEVPSALDGGPDA